MPPTVECTQSTWIGARPPLPRIESRQAGRREARIQSPHPLSPTLTPPPYMPLTVETDRVHTDRCASSSPENRSASGRQAASIEPRGQTNLRSAEERMSDMLCTVIALTCAAARTTHRRRGVWAPSDTSQNRM
eukprot:scaffold16697_cov95-Isochrysis_galbana.AAC.1